ncbi:MAG: hypothetical protein ACLRRT_06240 [Ruthenibacterium lactatiformans]
MENKKKRCSLQGRAVLWENLVAQLRNEGWNDLLLFDVDTPKELLADYAARADFVFHLAGVNRPQNRMNFTRATGASPSTCSPCWPRRATKRLCSSPPPSRRS